MRVPVLPLDVDYATFERTFKRTRAVLLRPRRRCGTRAHRASALAAVGSRFAISHQLLRKHMPALESTFTSETVETAGGAAPPREGSGRSKKRARQASSSSSSSSTGATARAAPSSASSLLGGAVPPGGSWYCSFVISQRPELVDALAAAVDPAVPPCFVPGRVALERALWFFVGRNSCDAPLLGRPPHTDAVTHDGTVHVQLEGRKVWRVRPTEEWLGEATAMGKRVRSASEREIEVVCEAGDLFCLSTRDWWHATHLPPQGGSLSVSMAREFNLLVSGVGGAGEGEGEGAAAAARRDDDGAPTSFINVDGLVGAASRHQAAQRCVPHPPHLDCLMGAASRHQANCRRQPLPPITPPGLTLPLHSLSHDTPTLAL